MKKVSLILVLAILAGVLAGCAGTPVVYYTNCTCPVGGHEQTPAPTEAPAVTEAPVLTDGAVKTGLCIAADITGSVNAGDENGKAVYDVTVVAVNVDDNGVITDCIIDSIGVSVMFDAAGMITSDLNAQIFTKNELGDKYGMKAYGNAKYEWYEQAQALADYAVGKTVEELKKGAVSESGHAVDADLAATATIKLGGYVAAIEGAVSNAKHLGAQAGDELRLAAISSIAGSTGAAADKAGTAQLDVDAVAMTMNGDIITGCYIDSLQAKVNFGTDGVITTDLSAPVQTKNELGEKYGMKAWGNAKFEWNEQAVSFAAYVTGKTATEVSGIAVAEGKPADADLTASVTIKIDGFQALIAKAAK